MKTLFISVMAFCMASQAAWAQIPNAGFENWTTVGAYETPDNWSTLNPYTASSGVFTATKGTPGSPGASFLKLTSRTIGATVANGIAVCGSINPSNLQASGGFAYTGQPQALSGKWQHMIYGNSQGSVSAQLTRWDATTNSRIIVATANQTLSGMAMSWANFSIPFTYLDFQAPDSCIIILRASGSIPTDQDYLWVDNLNLTGSVAGLQAIDPTTLALKMYPNPSTEWIQLSQLSAIKGVKKLSVLDLNGQEVIATQLCAANQDEFTLDLRKLTPGTYLLHCQTESGLQVKTFILQ
ncbi:MAG: hypothetical protein RLZZ301_736 [Bacteroidota bacterium]|jgi:hypothetical protein